MHIRVALVDDVEDIRAMVRMKLRLRGGFEVVGEAADGRSALEIVKQTRPDVVVLDLGLPKLAGRDLVTQLREQCPDSKIVVFSGTGTSENSLIRPWVEEYVDKQAEVDYLVELIRTVATRSDHTRTASTQLTRDESSPSQARRFVRDRCQEWQLHPVVEDAVLIVSELVTNAVIHAESDCEVRLLYRPSFLRIEVSDAGRGMPDVLATDEESEHGRGMVLTSAFSTAWGVLGDPPAKVVWAELPTTGQDVEPSES